MIKASELIKQAQELIDKYGVLEVLISLDDYYPCEFYNIEFKTADEKYHKGYFLI